MKETLSKDSRTTVRFPKKDWERMRELIEEGEYCCVSEVIRHAVKDFLRKQK